VPYHGAKNEIAPGTLKAILSQAGLDMIRLTATVEGSDDGTFTAVAAIGEHTIIGDGHTRDEALNSLRSGISGLIDYLKSEGRPLPQSSIELVNIEVPA
jgi:predicted RNase H-like HicB family nuclease